jgi:hypothetical protein
LLPLENLDQLRIAVVVPNAAKYAMFTEQLARYANTKIFDFNKFDEDIKYYNTIIVAGKEDDLDADCLAQLKQAVLNNKKVILCHFFENEKSKKSLSEHSQSDLIELLAPFFRDWTASDGNVYFWWDSYHCGSCQNHTDKAAIWRGIKF